jgi:hypothetical protein
MVCQETPAWHAGSAAALPSVAVTNLNQLPVSALVLGWQLTQQVANPFFGIIPATTSLGAPDHRNGSRFCADSPSSRL